MTIKVCCSWKECKQQAEYPQVSKSNQIWAVLCEEHRDELDRAVASANVRKLMGAWIKAQGGAKAAAERI